jgi:hypothetical protein
MTKTARRQVALSQIQPQQPIGPQSRQTEEAVAPQKRAYEIEKEGKKAPVNKTDRAPLYTFHRFYCVFHVERTGRLDPPKQSGLHSW